MDLVTMMCGDLAAIRERRPLIHSITNFVVMNETANAVLCIGALPVMSHAPQEVEEMAAAAGAVTLNIGTLEPEWVDAMELAGRRANDMDVPVILDPVGAGATRLRTDACRRLLDRVKISIVRGNAAEVAALAGSAAEIRGVESISALESVDRLASEFARAFGVTAAVTGPVDTVSDGRRVAKIANGHVMLSRVVGTGCMSSMIVGAFSAVQPDAFAAAAEGLCAFGVAGETAAESSGERPGSFHVELYNALYALDGETARSRARVSVL